jgi:hypothetical protein
MVPPDPEEPPWELEDAWPKLELLVCWPEVAPEDPPLLDVEELGSPDTPEDPPLLLEDELVDPPDEPPLLEDEELVDPPDEPPLLEDDPPPSGGQPTLATRKARPNNGAE